MTHGDPTKCEFPGCEKTFTNMKYLKRHRRLHLDKPIFNCELCDKKYAYSKDLKNHLDAVHKLFTYFCSFCEFTSERKEAVKKHFKNSHNLNGVELTTSLKQIKIVENSE